MTRRPRVLAVSSGGGHWVQLLRMRQAFAGCDVVFATVSRKYEADLDGETLHVFNDATRWNKAALVALCIRLAWIVLRVRPDVVVSTGAAPGYFAMRVGKVLGAKCIWIDSIANVEEISMTGRLVSRHADAVLTQWEHLVDSLGDGMPACEGAVL